MVNLVRDDFGFDLNFTLKNADGTAFDLTTATDLLFKMALPGADVNKVSGSMVVDDATGGLAHYTVASGDLDTANTYNAEIQVTFAAKVVTFPVEEIVVTEDLP